MAETTKIAWTDATFNPWVGCSKVSEGCQNCYAENLMANRYGRVVWGPNGTRSLTKTWGDPKKWNREAHAAGEKRKVFCASLADVFEDWTGPMMSGGKSPVILGKDRRASTGPASRLTMDDCRQDLFVLIDDCQSLYWLLLTKRPENIVSMWEPYDDGYGLSAGPRDNCWLGTSIANQKNADECIDRLLTARFLSPTLFLSLEPQIAFVDLKPWLEPEPLIQWVIIGGESKQGGEPRAFDMRWAEDMVEQCRTAGVPVFMKQMGSKVFRGKTRVHFEDGHGGDMAEWPEHLRVRECPETFAYCA